jgi:hypothetical protein
MSERVIFTVSTTIDQFLDRMARETGMDRSNLLRMMVWDWYTKERDRLLEERRHPNRK